MHTTAETFPSERSLADALRSFAEPLGCPVAYLEGQRQSRIERPDGNDDTLYTFTRGEAGIVSLPASAEYADAIDESAVAGLLETTQSDLSSLGGSLHWIGATFVVEDDPLIAFVDRQSLRQPEMPNLGLVFDPHRSVLDGLRGEIQPIEWRDGGGTADGARRVGAIAGGMLVALATAEAPIGRVTRTRVVVSPAFRKRGFGRLVLFELCQRVLKAGLLPYARLAEGNTAANALATAVGFMQLARSLALRIVAQPDHVAGTSTRP